MKKVVVFIIGLLLTACMLQKKVTYDLPIGLNENQKKIFLQNFNQGELMYAFSCANCHNKKVNNLVIVPNFTSNQLELYLIRTQNDIHSKKLTMRDITEEDLQKVIYYLKYKKK